MAAKNDITGASIQSIPTKQYQDNYSSIDWSVKIDAVTPEPENRFNELSFNADDFEIKPFVKPEPQEDELID